MLWAVVRTLGLERGYPGVAVITFTPYVAATAWLPVVVALALRSRAAALLALAAAVALVVAVAPRALDGPQPSLAGGRPLSVMTVNLAYGNGDPDVIMELVREHDVELLSLQEMTPEAVRRLDAAGARERFPHRALDARRGAQGSGIMARHALRDVRRPQGLRLAMPEATMLVPGVGPVRVKAVHPVAPLRGDVAVWREGLRSLPRATPDGTMRMLVGDFNATLDHDELRDLLGSGYVDAADAAGAGLHATYGVGGRLLTPPITIDHVLVDRRARVTAASVHPIAGSDHRAVVATIELPAAGET